ncbi:hypothetical protein H310_10253 [Aphanomyces invadans]|uniref:Mannosyltransferase n=1 Tax=Aphanomyces invadans TaxID=157072 RepID=A0A024TTA5_9STRA|nr:hypothetical protein H310_10253 [Aphanomyces invadans]ETV96542.1 hypothetical protein H310_10253 [Aphanomyces invadans]|eukprot:XP_008874805.1 hypothetical protein H310_10253 [Aphanomyces invadans]
MLRCGYYGGVALRVLCVVSMGMVHPDEFFQCPEVMAKSVFGVPHAFIPWEYKLPLPNRSVLFPSLVAGLPYALWKWLGLDANGMAFLLLPRLVLLALSFAYDATIAMLCRRVLRIDPWGPLFAFSTSWTTWIFLTRPFSNTMESLLVVASFFVLFHRPASTLRTALLGLTLALGTFARFTFIFFFLPLGLYLVWDNDRDLQLTASKKARANSMQTHQAVASMAQRLGGVVHTAVVGVVSFAIASVAVALLDTLYFHGGRLSSPRTAWVVAPWNNLIYNLDPTHLAEHGLHPRTNHWVVNMPLLFGPLALVFLYQVVRFPHKMTTFQIVCAAAVIVPVSALSMAPHQEARFLLPVLLPLTLVAPLGSSHRVVQVVWLVFNVSLGLWFGVLHQGGLLPLLLASGGSAGANPMCTAAHSTIPSYAAIITTGTYMPPRFALSPSVVSLLDVPLAQLPSALHSQQALGNAVLLAYPEPLSNEVNAIVAGLAGPPVQRAPVFECWPFISTESLPPQLWNATQWTLHAHALSWS